MALGASLMLTGCQSIGLGNGPTGQDAREQQGPSLAELLEDPNMVPVSEAEVRRYFIGNTAYWERLQEPGLLYGVYYDPSGEQRSRERQAAEATFGQWGFEGASFCQTEPGSAEDGAREGCGSFAAGPDGLLVFCDAESGCTWLVVGLNEGNSLSL